MQTTTNRLLGLRTATLGDAPALWAWRNEPATRAASYNSQRIPYEEHLGWVRRKLEDPHSRLLIAVDANNRDIGYVRLDLVGAQAEIHLSLDREFRHRGLGKALILSAAKFAIQEMGAECVVAQVKTNNAFSLAAFERAGFVRMSGFKIAGVDSQQLVYRELASHASQDEMAR